MISREVFHTFLVCVVICNQTHTSRVGILIQPRFETNSKTKWRMFKQDVLAVQAISEINIVVFLMKVHAEILANLVLVSYF